MNLSHSSKPELLRNPYFQTWSGGQPTEWTHQSTTNATYTQLQRTDRKESPRRTVFPTTAVKSDQNYIWYGTSGFRITMAAAASAGDWIMRQEASASSSPIVAKPNQHESLVITARCSVNNNDLRLRIVGVVGSTDTYWLSPAGGTYYPGQVGFEWLTAATNISLNLKDQWTRHGIEIPGFPIDIDGIAIYLSNGSAGAHVIDLGEVSLKENVALLGGAA